jgi:hypothetical protein
MIDMTVDWRLATGMVLASSPDMDRTKNFNGTDVADIVLWKS